MMEVAIFITFVFCPVAKELTVVFPCLIIPMREEERERGLRCVTRQGSPVNYMNIRKKWHKSNIQ